MPLFNFKKKEDKKKEEKISEIKNRKCAGCDKIVDELPGHRNRRIYCKSCHESQAIFSLAIVFGMFVFGIIVLGIL